jgi:hypothetical protein
MTFIATVFHNLGAKKLMQELDLIIPQCESGVKFYKVHLQPYFLLLVFCSVEDPLRIGEIFDLCI